MTGLAVLSYSMDEIMKMYGGPGFFSIQIHWEAKSKLSFSARCETQKCSKLPNGFEQKKLPPYMFIISSIE